MYRKPPSSHPPVRTNATTRDHGSSLCQLNHPPSAARHAVPRVLFPCAVAQQHRAAPASPHSVGRARAQKSARQSSASAIGRASVDGIDRIQYLQTVEGHLTFVRRYPSRLVTLGVVKPFKRKRLNTDDYEQARSMVEELSAELEAEVADWQRALQLEPRNQLCAAPSVAPDNEVRACDIDIVASRFGAMILYSDDLDRNELSPEEFSEYLSNLEAQQCQFRMMNACGNVLGFADEVHGFLASERLSPPRDATAFKALCAAMLRAQLGALRDIQQRIDGASIATPSEDRRPALRDECDVGDFDIAWSYWLQMQRPTRKTLDELRPVLKRLKAVTGESRVETLTREKVVAFRDSEATRLTPGNKPPRPQTVNKHMGLLAAMVGAVHDDFLKYRQVDNPFDGLRKLRVRTGDRLPRYRITSEVAASIFAGPVHMLGQRPEGGGGEAAYWVPLMLYALGTRLSEVTQMQCDDVQMQDGIWCVSLTNAFEEDSNDGEEPACQVDRPNPVDLSQKSFASRRTIPIHPELLRLGFLDYVQYIQGRGADALFPEIKPDCHGNSAGNFSKWFNRYLRTVGVKKRGLDAVSFRHALKTAGREVFQAQHLDYFQGHAPDTVGQTYGDFPVATLLDALRQIPLPGLENIPVWRAPA
jgi:integrase